MFLLVLNILLGALCLISIWTKHTVPGIFAIPAGIIGGITIYSRYLAWKTGAAQHGYELVEGCPEAVNKMKNIESLFWATGGFNLIVFLWYILK